MIVRTYSDIYRLDTIVAEAAGSLKFSITIVQQLISLASNLPDLNTSHGSAFAL